MGQGGPQMMKHKPKPSQQEFRVDRSEADHALKITPDKAQKHREKS
jgi:hypothetical protein